MIKRISKIFFNIAVISVVVAALFAVLRRSESYPQKEVEDSAPAPQENVQQAQIVQEEKQIDKDKKEVVAQENPSPEEIILPKDIVLEVPFVLQAPFANWDDPLFQDACEEAAILMAKGWLEGQKDFTKERMESGIRDIAILEEKILGGHIDASAFDTAGILKEYADNEKVRVDENVKLEDVKTEILKGNLVIVPTNGRKLGNPFYTAPGPVTHMIVIIGYDGESKEFITNDSGTRRGEGYRYGENVLFGAIRDYPTGNHYTDPIDERGAKKAMIVIERK
ncbi:MAG TPA: hypothetical protein DCX32_03150 [Candidatus Moranbacteria bacterium]|nr:MAG: hypothetical protein UW87_C0003G0023 [Candidatus Moranbacteria bacterium GW2011_GWC2_45_10]KKT95033.1 MAG: hypothetical protein UW95_C0005G0020 [Parcubacteria group bacterium GW2011_GWC1_45_14]HAV11516.1 hypothetical protein [Candidatus Moranbacteria bacterium]